MPPDGGRWACWASRAIRGSVMGVSGGDRHLGQDREVGGEELGITFHRREQSKKVKVHQLK